MEGKCPPIIRMNENGEIESRYPVYDPDWKDPEIYSTDTYAQEEKEEFYDYPTRCLKCGTMFIAYDAGGERRINFCPCCGKRLKGEEA